MDVGLIVIVFLEIVIVVLEVMLKDFISVFEDRCSWIFLVLSCIVLLKVIVRLEFRGIFVVLLVGEKVELVSEGVMILLVLKF